MSIEEDAKKKHVELEQKESRICWIFRKKKKTRKIRQERKKERTENCL